jgi:hypothetical protein
MREKLVLCLILIFLQGCIEERLEVGEGSRRCGKNLGHGGYREKLICKEKMTASVGGNKRVPVGQGSRVIARILLLVVQPLVVLPPVYRNLKTN